jgi:phosphoglycerate dehydrogenase-like enzyme
MNRRTFITASTALATVTPMTVSQARTTKRLKMIIPTTNPEQLSELQTVAPGVELVQCRNENETFERVIDVDALYGFITPRVIRAGKSLRWVQQPSAGVEHLMKIPELVQSDIILTNMQRAYAPEIADQAIGYLLAFTRSLAHFVRTQPSQEWHSSGPDVVLDELMGKTLLVIGLGGIGTEIARRATAFGMRWPPTPRSWNGRYTSTSCTNRPRFTRCYRGPTSSPAPCPSRMCRGR